MVNTGHKDIDRYVTRLRLNSLLRKLGLKSVNSKNSGMLTEEDIAAATAMAIDNFGRAEQIFMDQGTIGAFRGILNDDE